MNESTALIAPIDEKPLTKYVRFLVGSFRVGEAEDGEVLTRGLTAMLGSYPEFVVRAVCDPRSGLPATSKFFPTLYEVRSACEAKMRPLVEAEARRRREREVEEERRAPVSDADSARRKAFIAEWRMRQQADMPGVPGGLKVSEVDVRKCQGDVRGMALKALDGHLANMKAEYTSTPCAPLSKYAGTAERESA